MNTLIQRLIVPLVVVLVLGYLSMFKVEQWERAIVFQFREVHRTDLQPGLHFMIPFVNTVQKFETRLLNMNEEPQRFLTGEKKDVIVDYFVKWRIKDLERFYTATRGDLAQANQVLARNINSALRDEFSERPLQEVVAGDRGMVMDLVENKVTKIAEQLGIVIEDVRTMKIDLPENVSVSVYQRMRAERERVARDFRARGNEAAERIRANADREKEVIVANAFREAETIRGEGDARATEVYAAAFNKDREFYDFYRSTTAYLNGFNAENSILLLQPDSEFFKYFTDPSGIKPAQGYGR